MATNHVENSLSDILQDPGFGLQLNRSRFTSNDRNENDAVAERKLLQARLKNETPGTPAYKSIETQIAQRDAEIASYNSGEPTVTTGNRDMSLFNDKAYIDYARYVTADKWEDRLRRRDASGDLVKPFEFLRNSTRPTNQPAPGDPSLKATTYNDGLSLRNIIQWSEAYPSLRLRSQDFVYCKQLNVYPNNRLIVLRKFRNGVPDNLFDLFQEGEDADYTSPISTMVTWAKPKDGWMTLNFREVWTQEEGSFFTAPAKKEPGKESFFNMSLYDMGDNALLFALLDTFQYEGKNGKNEYVGSSLDGAGIVLNEPSGNPGLVRKAAKRQTGGKGLSSTISFAMKFEFEWRMIDNIDPTIAMLDLMSNCFRMGTDTSAFRMDYSLLKNNAIQKILNGQFEIQFDLFFAKFKDTLGKVSQTVQDGLSNFLVAAKNPTKAAADIYDQGGNFLGNTLTKSNGEAFLNTTAKHIISAYRESIKNALYSETGLPGGIYHVTIGNPKNPIVSCGDLIITESSIELGSELGLNDFPTSFTYNITVTSARERGRNELERILNAGRGRVYVYTNAADNPDYHITPNKATAPKK